MATDPEGGDEAAYSPDTDEFWPLFWFNVCKYSEYFYMFLVLVTVLGLMNVVAVLAGPQSTGAAVVSAMSFVFLGITWLGVVFVLWRCKQLRAPNVDDEDAPETRQELADRQDAPSDG